MEPRELAKEIVSRVRKMDASPHDDNPKLIVELLLKRHTIPREDYERALRRQGALGNQETTEN